MSGTIILKNSSVAGKIPLASDLQVGEVAVNTSDGKLFTKHTDNTIKTINKLALVPDGGTGLTTLASGYIPYGNGTGALSSASKLQFDGSALRVVGGTVNTDSLLTAYTSASTILTPKSSSGYSLAVSSGSGDLPSLQVSANGAAAGNLLIQPYGGNVGIGTSSPGELLHIYKPSGDPALRIQSSAGNCYVVNRAGSSGMDLLNAMNGAMTFGTNNTERMRIDSSGNVGIGTSSPSYKLDVGSFSTASAQTIRVAAASNNNSQIKLMEADDSYGFTVRNTAASGLSILRHNADATGTTALFIDRDTGNVGIGTTAPNASAILDAQSTTKGVRFPNMTTTQKTAISSPAAGLVVFDTTLAKLCVYSGAAWQTITSI